MSQQESTATFSVTQSELDREPIGYEDEHFKGALEGIERAIRSNAGSIVETIVHTKWHKNRDSTYSKVFTVLLKNGSEHEIHSKHTITEQEFFLRKLRHG